MQRVVFFAHGDYDANLVGSLVGDDRQVLGINTGSVASPAFSKRCAELNCDCVSTSDPQIAKLVVSHFKPDVAFCAQGSSLPAVFMEVTAPKYFLRVGKASAAGGGYNSEKLEEVPWPEFLPIWHEYSTSRVALVAFTEAPGAEAAAVEVPVMPGETALTLRKKHMEAGGSLFSSFLRGDPPQAAATAGATESKKGLPTMISLDWSVEVVDCFIRAHNMPPHEPAQVADPVSGETFFIENMSQYRAFLQSQESGKQKEDERLTKKYAADTHWYSNTGGTIVKMGDQNPHMPRRTSEGHFKMVIPGATLGGGPAKLRLNEPLIGDNAERYCNSALASSWIGVEGPFVKKFEAHLANICGCLAACAVQSGTAALYGAMKALGVSQLSHHVLCPAFTCAAAADAVVHAGGTPIAIDCELETYGISAEAVRAALDANPDVVGVVAAHCYGVPIRDIYEVQRLCQEKGIWLCEDACESYGASVHGKDGSLCVPIASIGTLNVISTRSEKMIGVGEGGAILGNDTTLVARAKWWCSRAPCRGVGLWRVYEHEGVGQNYRLPEMLACVGCAAAEMFPEMINKKRMIHDWYIQHIARPGLEEVKLQTFSDGDAPVWWVNAMLMPEGVSGEEVGMQLMKDYPDIEIRPGFFPLDQMAIFKHEKVVFCKNTDLLFKRLVCLPSSVNLREDNIKRICDALAASLQIVSQRSAKA
jgi:dTDP-4-amino-4,6-dideoxygalactose transaminase